MNRPYKTVPGIWGGIPVFQGSRVPVYFLVDYIESDASLDDFAEDYDMDMCYVEMFLKSPLPLSMRHAESLA